MSNVREQLKGKLVVSCQAAPGDPMEHTETIRRLAQAAVLAGAAGLRLNSAEHISAIRRDTDMPIIGIQKHYKNGLLRITPDFASAAALAQAGTTILALDCTNRSWPDGDPWQELIYRIHNELKLPVMADIATLAEARNAVAAGADFVGTTLNGYTEETQNVHSFNWSFLADLVREIHVPIIAEGHISTPQEARRAIANGAWCIVVGSAITRPGDITAGFVSAIGRGTRGAPAVGVDIGGTSIKAAVVARDGQVSLMAHAPTEASKGRDSIAANLIRVVDQVLSSARTEGIEPAGLGIASAGAIDCERGTVFAATENLPGWAGFNLRSFAEAHFHLSTQVVNDAHAAALAELHFGHGRSLTDFVAITIGTGIGGGIVSNGKLLRGEHGFAGTFGHHVIRMDGRPCNCGRRGCLEAYVSTAALLHEYEKQGGTAGDANGGDAAAALRISQLAAAGDVAAKKAYNILADYLAEGIANVFNVLDPQCVLVSGGLVEGHADFIAAVEKRVTEHLHFGVLRQPSVQLASAGHFAGVQGAAALVFER